MKGIKGCKYLCCLIVLILFSVQAISNDENLSSLVVVTVWAEDVPAAVDFYRDVIKLPVMPPPPDHHNFPSRFKLDGGFLIVMKGKLNPPENTDRKFPFFALGVNDFDKMVDHLKTKGVDLPWGIQGEGRHRYVMFYDPAGNLIELTPK